MKNKEIIDSEKVFINSIVTGNKKGLELLVQTYNQMIFNIAYKFTFNYQEAEDLTQEIFVKIIKNIKKFAGRSKLKTWIYSIAINHCINYKNKKKPITVDYTDYYYKNKFASANKDTIPENKLLNQELVNKVREAIDELPEKLRPVVILYELQQLPHKKISKILDIPEGTVWSRLNKAKLLLKDKLQEYIN